MKKLFFMAALGVAGLMSAENNIGKTSTELSEVVAILSETTSQAVCTSFIVQTSCGFSSSTCQNWTMEQAEAWGEKIETNYCYNPMVQELNEQLNIDDGIDWNQ